MAKKFLTYRKSILISGTVAVALGAAILNEVCNDSNKFNFPAKQEMSENSANSYVRKDSRQYFDLSLTNKPMTASTFPNHFKNPQSDLEKVITSNADDPSLINGLLECESRDWNPSAESPVGSVGLAQLLIGTANELADELGFNKITTPLGNDDWRLDPVKSAKAAILYLNKTKKVNDNKGLNDIRFAVAAYFYGSRNVDEAVQKAGSKDFDKVNDFLPNETQNYVKIVMGKKKLYEMILPFENNANFSINSFFGARNNHSGNTIFHRGIDAAAKKGTKAVSVLDGTVLNAGDINNGYGKQVWVADDFGNIHLYGHLDNMSVKKGQKVKQGQDLGTVGNSGRSKGTHLHYSLYDLPDNSANNVIDLAQIKGYSVDPMKYFTKKIILTDSGK